MSASSGRSISEDKDSAIKILVEAIVAILKVDMSRIVIGGSEDTRDFEPETDMDVAVVVKDITPEKKEKIYETLIDLELKYGVSISLAFYSELEYRKDKQTKSYYN